MCHGKARMNRFFLKKCLYKGGLSVVHEARDLKNVKDVIIKRCWEPRYARREFRALIELNDLGCRNIAELSTQRLIDDIEINGASTYKETSHPSALSLEKYMYQPRLCMTDADVAPIMRDVLEALSDMHRLQYIHADVKTENCMFDGKNYRLIDFGLALPFDVADSYRKMCGSPFYMAPEIIHNMGFSPACDMYSSGIMLYSLLHEKQHPFVDMTQKYKKRELQNLIAMSSYSPCCWENENAPLASSLCNLLLKKYPKERISAEEALQHDLFL